MSPHTKKKIKRYHFILDSATITDGTTNVQETVQKIKICTGRAAERECFRVSFDLSGYGILNSVRDFLRKTEIDDCSSKW
jgi:hypothetical protein